MLEKLEKIAAYNKQDLFKQIIQPDNFQYLVTKVDEIAFFALLFPNHKKELLKLAIQPAHFQRLIDIYALPGLILIYPLLERTYFSR